MELRMLLLTSAVTPETNYLEAPGVSVALGLTAEWPQNLDFRDAIPKQKLPALPAPLPRAGKIPL